MGIFDTDLSGTARTGTPGALEAVTSGGIGTITSVVEGNVQNTITFTAITDSTSYNLYWSNTPGVTTGSNKITGVTSPYVHTGLTNGTVYYYRYTGTVATVETGLSNELSGTPQDPLGNNPVLYATYSNDITSTTFGAWSSHSIGPQTENFRAVITFNISQIDPSATIGQIDLETISYWTSGNSGDVYYVGPYNGTGAGSPVSDGAATAYTRADCSSDYYLANDTTYRTVGTKVVTLGAQAITDLLAIRAAAGTTFTIALRQLNETGTQHYATFEGWTAGNDAPKLRMYSVAPSYNTYPVLFGIRN